MAPASSGPLYVERYIGACLISSQQPRKKRNHHNNQSTQQKNYASNYHTQQLYQPMHILSSYACQNQHTIEPHLPSVAILAQGAPLMLTPKPYHHAKQNKNKFNIKSGHQDSISFNRFLKQQVCDQQDSISIASDESMASDSCLPRIIKPRKRRKKDRRPPPTAAATTTTITSNLQTNQGYSTFEDKQAVTNEIFSTAKTKDIAELVPQHLMFLKEASKAILNNNYQVINTDSPQVDNSDEIILSLSDKLVYDSSTDINDNNSTMLCECKYCSPHNQVWKIDSLVPDIKVPYDPDISDFLKSATNETQQRSLIDLIGAISLEETNEQQHELLEASFSRGLFHEEINNNSGNFEYFPNLNTINAYSAANQRALFVTHDDLNQYRLPEHTELLESNDSVRLLPEQVLSYPNVTEHSDHIHSVRNKCLPSCVSTSKDYGGDLEVSAKIVTSLNGHRDLEIKFFSNNANTNAKCEPCSKEFTSRN